MNVSRQNGHIKNWIGICHTGRIYAMWAGCPSRNINIMPIKLENLKRLAAEVSDD